LDPVILASLLPTTLKRYCIQIFAARYFHELARLAKFAKLRAREKNGFYSSPDLVYGLIPTGSGSSLYICNWQHKNMSIVRCWSCVCVEMSS